MVEKDTHEILQDDSLATSTLRAAKSRCTNRFLSIKAMPSATWGNGSHMSTKEQERRGEGRVREDGGERRREKDTGRVRRKERDNGRDCP